MKSKKIVALVAVIALVAMLGICLVACNASDYKSRLEKADYLVVVSENDSAVVKFAEAALSRDYDGGIEFIVSATKGTDSVIITKFDKLKDAKTYEEDLKGGKDSKNVKRSDKWVFVGTEQGIKDAK